MLAYKSSIRDVLTKNVETVFVETCGFFCAPVSWQQKATSTRRDAGETETSSWADEMEEFFLVTEKWVALYEGARSLVQEKQDELSRTMKASPAAQKKGLLGEEERSRREYTVHVLDLCAANPNAEDRLGQSWRRDCPIALQN